MWEANFATQDLEGVSGGERLSIRQQRGQFDARGRFVSCD